MDRLLLLRLDARGCAAEAWINDIPVLRTGGGGGACSVPVHEFVFEGENELRLVAPAPPAGGLAASAPRVALQALGARLQLFLPRVGHVAGERTSRCLADVAWAVEEGELYTPGTPLVHAVHLPVQFPRWRWPDGPVLDIAHARDLVAAFLQQIAIGLARGDPEPLLAASRVRLEDVSIAYQLPLGELVGRCRSQVRQLHAARRLRPVIPSVDELQLRPCAGNRLLDCLSTGGEPALRTLPAEDGFGHAWPVRVTVVGGQCHVIR